MKNRVIAIFFLVFTMIYLSISVSAAETKLPVEVLSLHWLNWNQNTTNSTSYTSWNTTTNNSFNFNGRTLDQPQQLFIGVTLDSILRADQVIVWSFTITNTEDIKLSSKVLSLNAAGFDGNTSYNILKAATYDLSVLTETKQIIDDSTNTVRFTITAKTTSTAEGRNGLVWWMRDLTLADLAQYNRVVSHVNVFESIQAAAGSGTTPEEMRDVLSSWGEEELLPGIQDSVQSGVAAGMEEALRDEKNQASSGAQGGVDELAGALSGVTDDITQAKQSFETLGSALSYSGTSASLTFPAMTVPFLGTISEAQPINLTQQIDNIMPPTLLLIIRCALSIGIVSYPIFELIHQLRKLLDKG